MSVWAAVGRPTGLVPRGDGSALPEQGHRSPSKSGSCLQHLSYQNIRSPFILLCLLVYHRIRISRCYRNALRRRYTQETWPNKNGTTVIKRWIEERSRSKQVDGNCLWIRTRLQFGSALNLDSGEPALLELHGHLSQRHPFDSIMFVDVFDDPTQVNMVQCIR